MNRLNLTLDADTLISLRKHARGRPVAKAARELIREGLARAARLERTRKLARDYASGRDDARELLEELTPLELEALDAHAD